MPCLVAFPCSTVAMKKRVVAQSLRQTKVTFLCASLKSHLPVISCCTDMNNAAVAYYTNGQKREDDGTSIIIEQFFSDAQAMLVWLRQALSNQSIAPNVLRLEGGEVVLPSELPNPKRKRLPVPVGSEVGRVALAHMMALAFHGSADDIAVMRDVEGLGDEPAGRHLFIAIFHDVLLPMLEVGYFQWPLYCSRPFHARTSRPLHSS